LPPEWNRQHLPESLREKRNVALILFILQIFCALAGFVSYNFRKNRIYWVANGFNVLLAFGGLLGAVKMRFNLVCVHAFATTSILGAFFAYQVLEAIFQRHGDDGNTLRMSERMILLWLTIPYFLDFLIGLYSIYWTNIFNNEIEKREKPGQDELRELDNLKTLASTQNACVICMNKEKDATFYKCGHRCACYECAKEYVRTHWPSPKCPICRAKIEDVMRIYG